MNSTASTRERGGRRRDRAGARRPGGPQLVEQEISERWPSIATARAEPARKRSLKISSER